MPLDQTKAVALIARRHPEWREHEIRWRWLLDSLEGGDRYRYATYGTDRHGLPVQNLIRHKRECPDARGAENTHAGYPVPVSGFEGGPASYQPPTDEDYGLRLARTPVPTFLDEAVGTHLSRIFAREVKRSGPAALTAWWTDVDGRGTSIDDWMQDTVAPLLLVLGQLDLLFDHPAAPEGEAVASEADVLRLGIGRCVASYVLPENMLWWRLGPDGCYAECLVRECGIGPDDRHRARLRHWTADESTLYESDGRVVSTTPHTFGRVPIRRVFDRRKPRCDNVGRPRYESIAEIQREYYNRDSELILSDSTQAHPLLQGPEDFIEADGTMPIGPNWLLPKKKNTQGGSSTYEGFEVVDFPKDGAESIRRNKGDLRDEADRSAHLTKPAGTAGTSGSTVGQSGLSKRLDSTAGNDVLGKVAATLARVESEVARMALLVLGGRDAAPAGPDAVKVGYPRQFDLATASELAAEIGEFQGTLAASGLCPEVEEAMIARLVRLAMPGLEDAKYAGFDRAIKAAVDARSKAQDPVAQENMVLADANVARSTATSIPEPSAAEPTDPAEAPKA